MNTHSRASRGSDRKPEDLLNNELDYLVRRFQAAREFTAKLSVLPNARKEPPTFSARRAAEILDKSAASVSTVYRDLLHRDDTAVVNPGSPPRRHEINQADLTRLMDHYYGPMQHRSSAKVIVVENQKGGVGKTTTMVHLAPWLALHRYRVLAIDADPQASFTSYQGINPDAELTEDDTISAILSGDPDADGAPASLATRIRKSPHIENLDFVPACLELASGDAGAYRRQFTGNDEPGVYRFYDRLRLEIDKIRDRYDVILIDCPPHVSVIIYNAIFAADMIIVPLSTHMLDLASTGRFTEWLTMLAARLPGCRISKIRFLITNHDESSASTDNLVMIRRFLGEHLMRVYAQHSSEIQRAGAFLKSIYEVPSPIGSRDAWTRACKSMDEVNREIVEQITSLWEEEISLPAPAPQPLEN